MAISSPGIGSGLDINGIVSQLIAAERQPVEARLSRKESGINTELSGLGQLSSAIAKVRDSLSGLSAGAGFDGRKATSGNTDALSMSASSGAAIGQFDIEVESLAVAQRQTSAAVAAQDLDADVGTGTLAVSLGSDSFSVVLSSGSASLSEVRDAINDADDNPGVTATIINTDAGATLRLTSDRTGSDSDITLDASGGDAALQSFVSGFSVSQASSDARIYIDGGLVTSSSNTITGAIDGVSLNLLEAADNEPFTITIEQDNSAIASALSSFVSAFNEFASTASKLGSYNATTGSAGALNGDATLRGASNALRGYLSQSFGGGAIDNLAALGVTSDEDGRLEFDRSKLDAALESDFDSVQSLLSGDGGFVSTIEDYASSYLDFDGLIRSRTEGLNDQLDQISDDRGKLDERVERLESRYLAQFSALDALLAQMQQTSSFLSQQLAGISNLSKQG